MKTKASLEEAALAVVRRLQNAGHTAYWAGGCVRDRLLNRIPRDYDIATDALPEKVMTLFPKACTVGKHFGVVIIPFEGFQIETATFRTDHGSIDGRHPESVTFSTAPDDAARRDFTINAMFYDPIKDVVLDYAGGRNDLDHRLVRCVGDPSRRFAEDHLRMLRAVRFASTLDFHLDPATATAISLAASNLERISTERIRDEFTRTLMEAKRPGQALRLLDDLGLLPVFLPEVSALKKQDQPPQFHPEGDVFTHTALMLDAMEERSESLVYAILMHDIGKPATAFHDGTRWRFHGHAEKGATMAQTILRRLRLPLRVIEDVTACVGRHMRFMDVQNMRRSTLRRLMGSSRFSLELELHRLDCLASNGLMDNYTFLVEARQAMREEPVLPPPWITGKDLIDLGMKPGKAIGKLLKAAYDHQLEGTMPDRETLLEWVRQQTPNPSRRKPSS